MPLRASRCVPVTMGSPVFRTVDTGRFRVIEAEFPAGLVLPPHEHDRAVVAVMLDGSFDLALRTRRYECPPATLTTEPRGERHSNHIHPAGARVLVVQPDPAQEELLRPLAGLLDRPVCLRHPGIGSLAWRVAGEVRGDRPLREMAIEGLVLELLAAGARGGPQHPSRASLRRPAWLERVREILHERFRERLTVVEIAREAGVHPVHLARVFRRHYRTTLGDYIRDLRLDWATVRLSTSDEPVGQIAQRAGYCDQSHFTRAFRGRTGMPPERFRRQGDG